MFLIDRPATTPALRADLAPRQLFGGAGDLVRAALVARPTVNDPVAPLARRPAAQLNLDLSTPARRRKVG